MGLNGQLCATNSSRVCPFMVKEPVVSKEIRVYTFADWTLHKNTDGSFYVVKTVDGFTSGNFTPDANGIATITFNWNEHTGIMFKPPA